MRKSGFTLAEVLITLGIIGVIATLTLPTLMSNTAEREYSTAVKKAISSLTESVQMQVALENVSFDEMIDASSDGDSGFSTENASLYAFLATRMQTEKLGDMGSSDVCADGATTGTANCLDYSEPASTFSHAMFFRDGSALIFNADDTIETHTDCYDTQGVQRNCFQVIYDVNGTKKPNALANCLGLEGKKKDIDTAFDIQYDEDGNLGDDNVTCDKDNFNARDQYPLYLYGIGAYPGSWATRYIYNKK